MTICSYNNSGEIKYDVDIEMAQGYWNTSASRLWTKIRDNFHDELVAMYAKMRANGLSYNSLMSYFYGQQISKIPETYYNKDADTKYLPFATQYMGMAHGNGYEHLKRWLKNRLIFTDTLYDYAPSYNNDVLTIRANTTEPMTITIETYTPVYQHLSWYNNQMDKKKIDGKIAVTFTGTAQAATDQEVLIYGGSNIKRITGISSMNPNSMLIGSATRLIELDISNCPILATVNATGSNFTPHTYLNKLDISNCPNLTGTLRINNSPLLRELNANGTGIDTLQLAPSLRNLEVLRLPNTVTELTLNDAGLLNTLEFDEGGNLQRISLSNCPGIANSNIDLTKVPTVSLDNSLDKEEIYLSEVTNLTLKNMPTLKKLIFTPNNEYEEFDINNVINGKNYKVTTFNNPNMKEFITTAPHRNSYNNCGIIYKKEFIKDYDNLVDILIDKTPKNAIVNSSTGAVTDSSSGIHFTSQDYISVYEDTQYTITLATGNTSSALVLAFYDSDINFIRSKESSSWSSYTFTTPSNCNYIRYHIHGASNTFSTSELLSPTISEVNIPLKDYGDITPNKVFSANTLDLSDTQFTDIKFLCTTDLYNLKVPTTMKNFYCDSAMDIDTEVITEASYEVIHDELVEQYTTNYEGEVKRVIYSIKDMYADDFPNVQADANTLYWSDYIDVIPNSTFYITVPASNTYIFEGYDSNKTRVTTYMAWNTNYSGRYEFTSNNVQYIRGRVLKVDLKSKITLELPQLYTPNIIPSSASGSLIFNLYSNNTTQPASTSPYMWDLTGLKLNDFYTFGMNNDVRGEWTNITTIELDTEYSVKSDNFTFKVTNTEDNNGRICMEYYDGIGMRAIYIHTRNLGYGTNIDSWKYTSLYGGNTWVPEVTMIVEGETIKLYQGDTLRYEGAIPYYEAPSESTAGSRRIMVYSENLKIQKMTLEEKGSYPQGQLSSITMPQRLPGYSIRMVNADITPNNYANHLYPLLVDTTLPITGKLDYSKYKGTSLAWAYAYTTNDVAITPLDSRHIGGITNEYNKLYGTDYVDIVDVWAYKDDDFSNKSTNEAITKAYIELTQDNYTTRIDEVLQWYPNCTDLYVFDDGSVTDLKNFMSLEFHSNVEAIENVTFIEDYFSNLLSLNGAFRWSQNIKTVNNIPLSVNMFNGAFWMCTSLNCQIDLSNYSIINNALENAFKGCSALTYTPILPSNYTGSMYNTFSGCSALTTAPTIPNGVTSMNGTFQGCSALTIAPNIPEGVNTLRNTFETCTSLTTIPNIPSACYDYYHFAYGCSKLTSVPIDGWKGFLYETFKDCSSLNQQINISDGNRFTLNSTFNGCSSLSITPTLPTTTTGNDMNYCFKNCTSLTTAPTIPNGIINMQSTFDGCSKLTTAPNIPNSVTDMRSTFYGCTSLTIAPTIPDSVTDMTRTFQGCSKLTTVPNIPNSVTNMNYTFQYCISFTVIDTTNWDTGNVTDISGLFYGCSNLTEIKGIENWNTSKVTNVWDLFFNCSSIEYMDLSQWDMSNMTSTGCMYRHCSSLRTAYLPIQGGVPDNALNNCRGDLDVVWVGERTTDFNLSVYGHTNGFRAIDIQELVPEHLGTVTSATLTLGEYSSYLSPAEVFSAKQKGWTINGVNMEFTIINANDNVSGLTRDENVTSCFIELTSSNYKTRIDEVLQWYPNCTDLYLFEDGSVTDLKEMFYNNNTNTKGQIVKVEFIDGYFSTLTSIRYTFQNCTSLTTVSNIPVGVTDMYYTFSGCISLTTAPTLPNSVTNMWSTFQNCTSLTTVSNIPVGVTDMYYTFQDCSSLTTAPTIPDSVTNMFSTFKGCTSLTTVSNIPVGVTNMYYTFSGCSALTTVPNIPSKVTSMESTFQNCFKLTTVPNIPSNVKNMDSTFYGCSKLTTVPTLPDTVTDMSYTFCNCSSLTECNIPLTNLNYYSNCLAGCSSANITWTGERITNFSLTSLGTSSYTQTNVKDLVNNHLGTVESATLTLGETYLAYLTEEEIASAVAKGWTLQ